MKQVKKLNEGIRLAKEGIEQCWDDMGGQEMTTDEQGGQMSVTISMPGKNISVTTDSADEIGNILRLAGINFGGTPEELPAEMPQEMPAAEPAIMYIGAQDVAAEPEQPVAGPVVGDNDSDGDHDIHDHEAELDNETDDDTEEETDDEDKVKEASDTSYTSKGGSVTKTATGQVHKAGPGVYGGTETDDEAEYDRNDPKHPDYAERRAEQADYERKRRREEDMTDSLKEQARILQLAGVTEAQSPAQKAAFKAMIDKKNGDKPAAKTDDNKKPDCDNDGVPDWADKDSKKVKEDAPVTNSIFGQGVYEQSYARILELAGVAESKLMNSPAGTSMSEPKVYDSLPSGRGTGAGRKDYGANRANNQGENPMGPADMVDKVYGSHHPATKVAEDAFATAMGEYRKFVAEKVAPKSKK